MKKIQICEKIIYLKNKQVQAKFHMNQKATNLQNKIFKKIIEIHKKIIKIGSLKLILGKNNMSLIKILLIQHNLYLL
jgi:hypothetical protein